MCNQSYNFQSHANIEEFWKSFQNDMDKNEIEEKVSINEKRNSNDTVIRKRSKEYRLVNNTPIFLLEGRNNRKIMIPEVFIVM